MLVYVAVIGPKDETTPDLLAAAQEAGRRLARAGAVVVTGGLGGVMGAAADGVTAAGGVCVGLLPDADRTRAHPSLTIALPTGMGELRNGLVVRAADAVLAVGCSAGTLSEIALAVRTAVPVVCYRGWALPELDLQRCDDLDEAVGAAISLAGERSGAAR